MMNQFRKWITFGVVSLFLCTTLLFSGCSKDSGVEEVHIVATAPLLDVDISANRTTPLTQSEMEIMNKARALMDNHVKIEGGRYTLNIRQGAEIGLSERLFEYYKNCMNATNEMISTKKLMIYKGKLMPRQIKGGRRFKSGGTETSGTTDGGNTTTPTTPTTPTTDTSDPSSGSSGGGGTGGGGSIQQPRVSAEWGWSGLTVTFSDSFVRAVNSSNTSLNTLSTAVGSAIGYAVGGSITTAGAGAILAVPIMVALTANKIAYESGGYTGGMSITVSYLTMVEVLAGNPLMIGQCTVDYY